MTQPVEEIDAPTPAASSVAVKDVSDIGNANASNANTTAGQVTQVPTPTTRVKKPNRRGCRGSGAIKAARKKLAQIVATATASGLLQPSSMESRSGQQCVVQQHPSTSASSATASGTHPSATHTYPSTMISTMTPAIAALRTTAAAAASKHRLTLDRKRRAADHQAATLTLRMQDLQHTIDARLERIARERQLVVDDLARMAVMRDARTEAQNRALEVQEELGKLVMLEVGGAVDNEEEDARVVDADEGDHRAMGGEEEGEELEEGELGSDHAHSGEPDNKRPRLSADTLNLNEAQHERTNFMVE